VHVASAETTHEDGSSPDSERARCRRALAHVGRELADDLGASRENVSRVLEGFRRRGWLVLGRRRIEVTDPSAIEAVLDEGAESAD